MLYSASGLAASADSKANTAAATKLPVPTAANCTSQTKPLTNGKLIFAPTDAGEGKQAIQYRKGALDLEHLHPASPTMQFHQWYTHARTSAVYQPEAVVLATAELPSGRVSSRVVFLKELDDRGFVVYSNWHTSRKAADIRTNPNVSLTFWWHEVERQVRVEGKIERLPDEESQLYYDTRVRGSRIGAWASPQSAVLNGREELEQRVKDVEKRFEGQEKIPVPPFWGGARVVPERVEFWQGRESRLHDRFQYVKQEDDSWKIERLSP